VLSAGGQPLPPEAAGVEQPTTDEIEVTLRAPAPEGDRLEIEVAAGVPIAVTVSDLVFGLPPLPGSGVPRRPEGYRPRPHTLTDLASVSRTIRLAP
jgi:hypothetical protein